MSALNVSNLVANNSVADVIRSYLAPGRHMQ